MKNSENDDFSVVFKKIELYFQKRAFPNGYVVKGVWEGPLFYVIVGGIFV